MEKAVKHHQTGYYTYPMVSHLWQKTVDVLKWIYGSWIYGGFHRYMVNIWLIFNQYIVLLGKIEGPVWHTIYHHLPVVKGVVSNPSMNQPTNGNLGHLC